MGASVEQLHDKARRAIAAGEGKFRDAAEALAEAKKRGASQRQSAKAIGKSAAWVNAILKWRASGYKDACPFPRAKRRVQAAEQKHPLRRATTPEQAQVERAKAEFQKARAEAIARMFGPETKRIPKAARVELIAALKMLASSRDTAAQLVERQRQRLNLDWSDLLVPSDENQSSVRLPTAA